VSPALSQLLLIIVPAAPLLAAALALAWPRAATVLTLAAGAPAVAAAFALPVGAAVGLDGLLYGARLGLDATGGAFLFPAALVWLAAALYALGGRGLHSRGVRSGFPLAMAGNFAMVLAQDAATLFAAYALMSFSAYLLVVERGDAAAWRAGRVYIALVVVGEVVVLSGLILAANAAVGPPQLGFDALRAAPAGPLAWGLLWVGFGIKAALVPLHFSLPLAYGATRTAGATALAGAMVNAGLLGWLRLLPGGEAGNEVLGQAMMLFGLLGAFYGALVGVTQTHAHTLLGYSSVSQMGLMAVGVGAGLAAPESWPLVVAAVGLYALHHALAKAALFVGVGVAEGVAGASRRLAVLLTAVPALALAGVPLTSGALAKPVLKDALIGLGEPWGGLLGLALPLATVGTTLLMARLLYLVTREPGGSGVGRAPWLSGALLLAGVLLSTGWWPGGSRLVPAEALSADAVWAATWPVAVGAAVAAAVLALHRLGWLAGLPGIPAGDVAVPVEGLARRVWRLVEPAPEPHHAAEHEPQPAAPSRLAAVLERGEGALSAWGMAALLVLLTAVGVALVALA
jgi:formate hydrogenlyase subunit 3/multisubunit Na+/H+ antiporter MnhD subunit